MIIVVVAIFFYRHCRCVSVEFQDNEVSSGLNYI